MIKKIFVLFTVIILLTWGPSAKSNAVEEDIVTAPSAILMEPSTGKILFEKNAHEKRACASITKIMTVLLAFEAIDNGAISINDMVSASEHAASMGGSDIWLKSGEAMSVDDLIKATVVASANDAAVVLAERIAGTEEAFVNLMNKKAKDLHMDDTTFKNCNGLDEDGHITSAFDVSLMSREIMKHEQIYKYAGIWIDYLREGKTQLVNTNKLLKSYKGITGLKTGTTNQAGCCISATAKRGDISLNAVVLGSKTTKDRFKDAASLLDYGFDKFTMIKPKLPDECTDLEVKVINGVKTKVKTKVDETSYVLVPKGKENLVKSKMEILEEVQAPVYQNQILGKIVFSMDNSTVLEYNINADENISQINFSLSFFSLLKGLFKM